MRWMSATWKLRTQLNHAYKRLVLVDWDHVPCYFRQVPNLTPAPRNWYYITISPTCFAQLYLSINTDWWQKETGRDWKKRYLMYISQLRNKSRQALHFSVRSRSISPCVWQWGLSVPWRWGGPVEWRYGGSVGGCWWPSWSLAALASRWSFSILDDHWPKTPQSAQHSKHFLIVLFGIYKKKKQQVFDLADRWLKLQFTSPFSKGTMREYSVVQIRSSSLAIRALGCFPNRSIHSRFESATDNEEY